MRAARIGRIETGSRTARSGEQTPSAAGVASPTTEQDGRPGIPDRPALLVDPTSPLLDHYGRFTVPLATGVTRKLGCHSHDVGPSPPIRTERSRWNLPSNVIALAVAGEAKVAAPPVRVVGKTPFAVSDQFVNDHGLDTPTVRTN